MSIQFRALASLGAILLAICTPLFQAAGQAAPVCKGKDLLAEMRKTEPLLHAAVMAEAAGVPNGGAILWKIEGGGAPAPSWLLGTIHLSDDRVAVIEGRKRQVLDSVETVALEIAGISDPAYMQKEIAANPKLIVLPQGETLWGLIDPRHERDVEERLAALGISRSAASRLQPWLPALMLSKSECQAQRQNAGKAVLDQAIEDYASGKGRKLVGLETVAEQLGAMSSMSIKSQAAFLVDSMRMAERMDDMNETLIKLYLNRDIAALLPFQAAYLKDNASAGSAEASQEFIQALIVRRNRTMAERAEPLLRQGSTLIAVGALHLPGAAGLVQLIRRRGFQVTPVD